MLQPPKGRIRVLLSFCLVVGLSLAVTSTAHAMDESNGVLLSRCASGKLASDGTRRQSFDAVENQQAISAIPPRTVIDVEPGVREPICIGFQNRSGHEIDLMVETFNVGMDKDGAPLTTDADQLYGAGEWIDLPVRQIKKLKHGDIAWMIVHVDVPKDAAAGSWYASVKATLKPSDGDATGTGIQVQQSRSMITQVFVDVPGERVHGGKIVDVRMPRVIWWDGLGIRDVPVLDRLRGFGVATMHFDWQNQGTVTDMISGDVVIKSDLGGRQVASIPFSEITVMRGAKRTLSVTWSHNVPMAGRFTPTIQVRDITGKVHSTKLDSIWVIPAWWYIISLFAAIMIPVTLRRRARRRYNDLLERIDRAEHELEDAQFEPFEYDDNDLN